MIIVVMSGENVGQVPTKHFDCVQNWCGVGGIDDCRVSVELSRRSKHSYRNRLDLMNF